MSTQLLDQPPVEENAAVLPPPRNSRRKRSVVIALLAACIATSAVSVAIAVSALGRISALEDASRQDEARLSRIGVDAVVAKANVDTVNDRADCLDGELGNVDIFGHDYIHSSC